MSANGPVSGEATLADRLAEGRMPLGEAVEVLDALCDVVGEAHRRGAVHGSLQPSAVRVSGDRVTVAGLGDPGTAPPAAVLFLSPQQLEGKPADERADVFALGVIGYLAITGADAFGGEGTDAASRLAAIERGATDPRTYVPKLNERVARTLQTALARNLTERFADALTMRAALRGDSTVALDSPTLRWAVAEGIPAGDTGAADEYASSDAAEYVDPGATTAGEPNE
jgi:serine/threonine protein kinase